jgi:hypothetical protein
MYEETYTLSTSQQYPNTPNQALLPVVRLRVVNERDFWFATGAEMLMTMVRIRAAIRMNDPMKCTALPKLIVTDVAVYWLVCLFLWFPCFSKATLDVG